MSLLTVDFPEPLAQQIEESGITPSQLQAVIVRFVELYISNHDAHLREEAQWKNGAEFAQRLMDNNRQLFVELAKH